MITWPPFLESNFEMFLSVFWVCGRKYEAETYVTLFTLICHSFCIRYSLLDPNSFGSFCAVCLLVLLYTNAYVADLSFSFGLLQGPVTWGVCVRTRRCTKRDHRLETPGYPDPKKTNRPVIDKALDLRFIFGNMKLSIDHLSNLMYIPIQSTV